MKKITVLVASLIMLFQVSAYATVTDNNDMTVNISENTGLVDAMMTVEVILPGYTYEDLLEADKSDYLNMLAYREQTVTDSEGLLDMNFKLRAENPSGNYTFIIRGMNYKKEITSFVLNDELSKVAMETIENAIIGEESDESNINTIKTAIMSYSAEYGIDKDGYASEFTDAEWEKVATLSYNFMKEENITEIVAENMPLIFNKGVAVVSLENGLVENITEDSKLFDLEGSELAEWYTKDFVTDFTGERMAERLRGKTFDTFSEFDEALIESFVLSVIERPDGAGNTKAVMQAFSDYIGTGSTGKDKKYANVSDKNWDSYEELREAFNSYKESNSGDSSGSSGSSGRKPSTSTVAVIPPVNTETKKETEVYPLTIFNDIDTVAWAEEAIISLTEQGILNGVGDKLFAPDRKVTREEFAAMLERAFLASAKTEEIKFSDVLSGAWYYDSVAKAYGAGIVHGESESIFGTGKNITRQDMAVMLYRAAGYVKFNIPVPEEYVKFDDDAFVSDYAKDAVYALRAAGIINGVSESAFAPTENATRAQAAKMIYGLLEL